MLDKQAKNEYTEKGKGAAGRRLAPHKLMEVTACLQGLAVTFFIVKNLDNQTHNCNDD